MVEVMCKGRVEVVIQIKYIEDNPWGLYTNDLHVNSNYICYLVMTHMLCCTVLHSQHGSHAVLRTVPPAVPPTVPLAMPRLPPPHVIPLHYSPSLQAVSLMREILGYWQQHFEGWF